jgi:hypothetical protein
MKEKAKLKLKIINKKLNLVYELKDEINTLLAWEKKEAFVAFVNELQKLANELSKPKIIEDGTAIDRGLISEEQKKEEKA